MLNLPLLARHPHLRIVAASKTQSAATILKAFQQGYQDFGENRVEEALAKIGELPSEVRQKITWHFIGHLQSRKVAQAVELFDWIQSIDSLAIAQKVSSAAVKQNKILTILVQVNISGETSKSGFAAAQWQTDPRCYESFAQALVQIHTLPHLQLQGLMTIAPQISDPEQARPYFHSLQLLQQKLQSEYPQLNLRELSMGMTEDYKIALEEGATIIRLGRAIFGERQTVLRPVGTNKP